MQRRIYFLYTGEYYDGVSDLYYLRAIYLSTASEIQSVLMNKYEIYYMSVLSGMMNYTLTSIMGGTEEECEKAFIKGMLMGAFLGGLQYFVVGAQIISLAQFYLISASASTTMSLTLHFFAILNGNKKEAVITGVLALLSFVTLCDAYNMNFTAEVIGEKGSFNVKYDNSNPKEVSIKSGKNTVEVNGKTVYTDDGTFDPFFVDKQGRTNIERMEQGLAPIGTDGKSVNIHHIDQTNDGPVMEIIATDHQKNYSDLHTNTGQEPSKIDRKEFNSWRRTYWKWRSKHSD